VISNADPLKNPANGALNGVSEKLSQENEFRTLAENLPDNIIRYDHLGRTIYCWRRPKTEPLIAICRS